MVVGSKAGWQAEYIAEKGQVTAKDSRRQQAASDKEQ